MKTLRNIILGAVLTLALALVMSAQAEVKTKGGASELLKKTEPVSAPADIPIAMTCPKCKSEFSVRSDRFARGVTKPTVISEKHLCDQCGTVLKTVGQGKQATQLALHTCSTCK